MLRRSTLLIGLLSLASGLGAEAEWLVTTDGEQIETSGPWRVRRDAAYFHLIDGTYSTLPRESIDLAASRRLTQDRRKPSPPKADPVETRTSVLRITDDDVGHVDPVPPQPQNDTGGTTARAPVGNPVSSEPLVVLDWERGEASEDGTVVITGEIQNTGRSLSEGIELRVEAYGETGVVTSSFAKLAASTLKPGQRSRFQADLVGLEDDERLEFSLSSRSQEESPGPAPK